MIVRALFEAGRPVRASEIASGFDGRLPALDPASVYRNLDTLEQAGVIRRVRTADRPSRYVLAGGCESEYLACDRCGALVEADPAELDGARAVILERFGYQARFSDFPIVGRCPSCAETDAG
jgi:Fur family ferric uptake transcriptional regulator